MSSKLIPPKESAIFATVLMKSSTVLCVTSISNESILAKRLNKG